MKDWLPITARNRVALGLAFAGLVTFAVWNCLPNHEYASSEPDGNIAMTLWPDVFSPGLYLMALKDPGFFLVAAAYMALIQNALVPPAAMPFWKHLHASPYIRLPLAIVNLLGGSAILWITTDASRNWVAPLILMALNMFLISAALFTFRNELELRSRRMISNHHGP